MGRTILSTLVLALVALLAVGCSGSGEAPATGTTDAPADAPAIEPAPTSPPAAKGTAAAGGGDNRGGHIGDAGTGAVARVNGDEITWAELDGKAAAKLVRLRTQAYELRKQTLDELINTRLMEAEAVKRGITLDELKKVEVNDKVDDPTDEEAKAYFDANPPRRQVEFDSIKPRVKAFMKRQEEQELEATLVASLRATAGVEIFLEPLRFDVDAGTNNPIYGSPDAPIQIIEFSEFQCPYCSRVQPAMEQVKETYGDKVAITFRDYPLPMHGDANKAAEAGHCANEQGKFWPLHDIMFSNQRGLQVPKLKGYATEAGLDAEAFASCLDSGKYADQVAANKADGDKVGVTGTPAFFINGQFLNGARPFEAFKEVIDSELEAKGLP